MVMSWRSCRRLRGGSVRIIEVSEADYDLGAAWANLQHSIGTGVGAIAGFSGLVRESTTTDAGGSRVDEPVKALVLEHYPGMTQTSMAAIVQKAEQRWELLGVHVVHRVGRFLPGEQIVMVLVAAGHRAAAFAACEYIMDYLKTDAVLWKREEYVHGVASDDANANANSKSTADSGARWLHSAAEDKARRAGWNDD